MCHSPLQGCCVLYVVLIGAWWVGKDFIVEADQLLPSFAEATDKGFCKQFKMLSLETGASRLEELHFYEHVL